jgi:hypothetical protein
MDAVERWIVRELEQKFAASPQQFSSQLADFLIAEPVAALPLLLKCSPPPLTNLSSRATGGNNPQRQRFERGDASTS